MAAVWSKLEGYTPRFALVHHLIRCAADENVGDAIDAESMLAAIEMTRWFGREARRVYSMLAEDSDARQLRRWVERIEGKGGSVTVREWQRMRSRRTTEDAKTELAKLVAAGEGRLEQVAPGPKGGAPSTRFILNEQDERANDDLETCGEPERVLADDEWGEL